MVFSDFKKKRNLFGKNVNFLHIDNHSSLPYIGISFCTTESLNINNPTIPSATMNCPTSTPQKWPPVIKRVIQTVERFGMFRTNENVLVGVSGGPDSMALLHILCTLDAKYRLKLAVAHLNHGLRPIDADRDESFVKRAADKLRLPFHRHQANLQPQNGSVEEQARKARYAFFHEMMEHHGYTKIALGHQKNDNAEAVLMHLLRGSGIRGLAGIPPVRDRRVVRPLIDLDRSEIITYLKDHQIPYVVDATNTDPAYERNRIRHHLIPLLEKDYNAGIVETLHRTADLCREEEAWFTRYLQPLLDKVVNRSGQTCLELNDQVLTTESRAVQRRLIRGALSRWHGHLRRMGANHIESVIALIPTEAMGKKVSLPNGITAVRHTTGLCFGKGDRFAPFVAAEPSEFCYTVPEIDQWPQTIDIPESNCRLILEMSTRSRSDELPIHNTDCAWFDLDALTFPLHIRSFRPGDRINPYGMQGSQKVKKLFIDRKIQVAQRQKIPLLESQGTLLWVAGIRRSNQAIVSEKTRRVLLVKVDQWD
jgi:tRNA(Ile)-lysidine synthase